MNFLANENFPMPGILSLREKHTVISILEIHPGISDEEVVEIARRENLIILTFDSDYGEIVFRYGSENPPSVIFFRQKGQSPDFAAKTLAGLIEQGEIDFNNAFTVVEVDGIRQRKY